MSRSSTFLWSALQLPLDEIWLPLGSLGQRQNPVRIRPIRSIEIKRAHISIYALPTGGADPLCVSQLKPEKANWPEARLPTLQRPEDPCVRWRCWKSRCRWSSKNWKAGSARCWRYRCRKSPKNLLPKSRHSKCPCRKAVEELLPEVPVLEVPLPEVVEELEPEEPELEEPLPELVVELAPDDPLWAGLNGIVPPPHPARIRSANDRTLATQHEDSLICKNRVNLQAPLWPAGMRRRRSQISDLNPETSLPARPGAIPSGAPT